MVKPPKRASKRVSTKQRTKIQKKVREHHRKTRRDAKKNPTWRSKRKEDPGIPNSFPYKEKLLDEIEQTRQREEQRKLDLREKRLAERRGEGEGEGESDEDVDVVEEEEVSSAIGDEPLPPSAQIFDGSLAELLADDSVKNIVFALDARDPLAWRCEQVEALALGKGKNVTLALTKADLVPLEALASHMHALTASSSSSKNSVAPFPVSIHSESSLNKLAEAIKAQSGDTALVGFENSGKSAVAAALAARLESSVLDTTHLIALQQGGSRTAGDGSDSEDESEDEDEDDSAEFLRRKTAGLRALYRNKGQVFRVKDALPLVWALIPLVTRNEDLMLLYNVPAFGSYQPQLPSAADAEAAGLSDEDISKLSSVELDVKTQKDAEEFLIGLARQQGRARKGGIPDVDAAARVLLRDWCAGCVAYYSYAPGWVGGDLTKAQRESIVSQLQETLQEGESSLTQPRRDWKKTFAETQRARSDLHPSPAIGELRLKSAGSGALSSAGGSSDVAFEFWRPREAVLSLDMDEDEDEGEDEDEDEDEDEELDSDALVPDSEEDSEEDDEEVANDLDADQVVTPVVSRRDKRRAAKESKVTARRSAADEVSEDDEDEDEDESESESAEQLPLSSSLKKTGARGQRRSAAPKKRVRMVEPTKAEKRRR
ncbi:unnamed protein product [Parajaminaea phylloscopi]